MKLEVSIIALVFGSLFVVGASAAHSFGAENNDDFFEAKIRPVLVEHCHSCHSTEAKKLGKLKGGLRLDTKPSAFQGGESGAAIVAGNAQKSLLISALKYESLEMPPNEKLPDNVVREFEKWIDDGASWPGTPTGTVPNQKNAQAPTDYAKLRLEHWAWRPVATRMPADVPRDAWPQNTIDRYVVHELRKNGMVPSSPAAKAVWFRRVNLDLLGIPARYDDVLAFENDTSPDAYQRAVDRILSSPRYGERWARHWLDIARYADNGGFNSQTKELYTNYPFAFTYRDYVINAFNRDLPYDRFIVEQLAADKLSLGEDNRALAALGFLTLGDASFGVSREDRIDDCIDTVTRGLMATTVSCARCHDHKYDPIPTADYYSLFGIFKNSNIRVLSRLHTVEKSQKLPALFASSTEKRNFEDSLRCVKAEWDAQKIVARTRCREHFIENLAEYLLAETGDSSKNETRLDKQIIKRIKLHLEKEESDSSWAVWKRLRSLDEATFEIEAKGVLQVSRSTANQTDLPLLDHIEQHPLASLKDAANAIEAFVRKADAVEPADEKIATVWIGDASPFKMDETWLQESNVHGHHEQLSELQSKYNQIRFAQPRAPALSDTSRISESHVLIRGAAGKRGEVVPRQFLALLSDDREPYSNGSGRLELARAIIDRKNPLTARVMVNRIWLHLMGRGIVDSPGDFGTRCEVPVHIDLLDHLADFFMENNWSIKKLQRLIVLSNTYRQSSQNRDGMEKRDPENRLLWRMNRKRLSFETLRDSLLVASGNYDFTAFGPAQDLWKSNRRTIYGYVNRYRIADGYLTFDFPNPSRTADHRLETMVPQQSLFLMNSPFVEKWASDVVDHDGFHRLSSNEDRIGFLFKRILSRTPRPSEIAACVEYLAEADNVEEAGSWRQLAHGLFLSNEFIYID